MLRAGLPKFYSTLITNQASRSCGKAFLTSRSTSLISKFSTSSIHNGKVPYIDTSKLMDKNGIETPELIKQRKQRPISPHLTIYQPQLTWYMSSLHRLSLIFLGLAFYGVTMLFGLGNLLGLDITTQKLVDWYHDKVSRMNRWVGLTIKASFAYLFALQYGGAIRHLIWDTARELTLKGVYRTGYALIGFTVVAGTYLLTL